MTINAHYETENLFKDLYRNLSYSKVAEISDKLYEIFEKAEDITKSDIPVELWDNFKNYIMGSPYYVKSEVEYYFFTDFKDWYNKLPL
jgi:hypothetical protein